MTLPPDRARDALVAEVRRFVEREVVPAAPGYDQRDEYPAALVDRMRELGLFGVTIAEEYGGAGLPYTTYVEITRELARGWMSLCGVISTHLLAAYMVERHGLASLRERLLPRMATGEWRAGFALTEAHAGSDVQAIRTAARRDGGDFVVNGSKAFITNAEHADLFAVLVRTESAVRPADAMTMLIIERRSTGVETGRHYDKLGYRGIETADLFFDDCRVPAENAIGDPGRGFAYAMEALEVGRINVAARAVGVAEAALEASIAYAQQREAFGKPIAEHQAIRVKLADMATEIEAARLLTQHAAEVKDSGERSDLQAGMAKLFASEVCQRVTLEAMRIHGGFGYTKDASVERYYRDAPLMILGEGTNEIQRLIISRRLLEQRRP